MIVRPRPHSTVGVAVILAVKPNPLDHAVNRVPVANFHGEGNRRWNQRGSATSVLTLSRDRAGADHCSEE